MKKTSRIIAALIFVLAATLPSWAGHLDDIQARGKILVGMTGDYIPMSYRNPENGKYEGFDVELAQLIADSLHVGIDYVATTWPTLTKDTIDGKFDIALCGISRTFDRARLMQMSDGYLVIGKTILCRKDDADKFTSLSDINKPDVRVMVNPGGTNEKFARENLGNVSLLVHDKNAEIPGLVAEGEADIMITETVEAARYVKLNKKLAAPLVSEPFTKQSFGILMAKGDQELLNYVNFVLAEFKLNGTLAGLENKYLK